MGRIYVDINYLIIVHVNNREMEGHSGGLLFLKPRVVPEMIILKKFTR